MATIFEWLFGAKDSIPPDMPWRERGPLKDADEQDPLKPRDLDGDGLPDAIEGVALGLEYADVAGEISVRRVVAAKLKDWNSTIYVTGWCLLRNDWRTFRADRMIKLMLPPKWQEVSSPEQFLRQYLPPKPERRPSPRAMAYQIKMAAKDGLSVLAYVARADGEFAAAEEDVVRRYIADVAAQINLTVERDIVELVFDFAETLYPTKRTMSTVLKRLDESADGLAILVPRLEELVKSDGDYDDAERAAVSDLLGAMKRARDRRAKQEGG